MCISPISIRGKKTPDNPLGRYTVPCGKCYECLQAQRENWAIRLEEEAKDFLYLSFVTLTYDDDNLYYNSAPGDRTCEVWPSISKEHLQKFFKRLRISLARRADYFRYRCDSVLSDVSDVHVRYFAVGEYGSKSFRPHYHIILFGLSEYNCDLYKLLTETWPYGSHYVGDVTPASIRYTCKYMLVPSKPLEYYESRCLTPPFRLMSRKPALGCRYISMNKNFHEQKGKYFYPYVGGGKGSLPRYYKDHLYSESARARESAYARRLADVHDQSVLRRVGHDAYLRLQSNEWEARKMEISNFVRRLQK